VSITSLLPRLSGNGNHRIHDELDRLKEKVRKLLAWQEQADDYFNRIIADRADVYAAWEDERTGRTVAEAAATQMRVERDEWRDRALALQARFGAQIAAEENANRITVPPMVRPISGPEEQATGPIDVRALWDARDAGLLGPVLGPGHATTH